MREKMRAGPGCEDLKVRSPYFYTVAAALHPVTDSDTLANFVNSSFRDRYQVAVSAFVLCDEWVYTHVCAGPAIAVHRLTTITSRLTMCCAIVMNQC